MNTKEAFETLFVHLRQSLKDAQEQGSRAFQDGKFAEASAFSQNCQQIQAKIDALTLLQKDWPVVKQTSHPPVVKQASRPPVSVPAPEDVKNVQSRGKYMPTRIYWPAILQALADLGGSARTAQVIEKVEQYLKPHFKPEDYETVSDGNPRWQVAARFERQKMVYEGLLSDNSPRGIWEITEKGREQLKKYSAK